MQMMRDLSPVLSIRAADIGASARPGVCCVLLGTSC